MDDDVLELLSRSRPRPVSEDPAVAAATRELVRSTARTARRRSGHGARTGFVVGIAIAGAACAVVLPILTNPPSTMVDAGATQEPHLATEPSDPPSHGWDSGGWRLWPESIPYCTVLTRIVPDRATADENLTENLASARTFLRERDLALQPLHEVEASVPSGPDGLAPAAAEQQTLAQVEGALAEAGLLLPGVRVEVSTECERPGAP